MKVVGIAIGGTKTAVTFAECFSSEIKIIDKEIFPTNPYSDIETIDAIFNIIDKYSIDFDEISIICGGPLDTKNGIIQAPPHLPGFKDTKLVDIFTNKYHKDVTLLNDADACALAEYKFGGHHNSKNMAYLTFGTGIGAGLILNGKLYTGNNSMAGEIGHVKLSDDGPIGYGKRGSAEGWCAGGNIYKWAKLNDAKNTKELFQLARENNIEALVIIDKLAKKLGETASILLDILNLDTIVIGGIYPRNIDLLETKVKSYCKENTIESNYHNCVIVPSKLNEKIDDYSSLMGVYTKDIMETFYERYPSLISQKENIEKCVNALINCYRKGGKILVCGNGGSASDSAHIVGELMKGFLSKRKLDSEIAQKLDKEFGDSDVSNKLQAGIPCIDLTAQSALITAFANDVDPNLIFAQQVLAYSSNNLNDVVIGISTSGNSKNVVAAIKTAKSLGLKTIALTGDFDSELSINASICIKAPAKETYKIQEFHLPIYHYICAELEKII